MTQLKKIIDEQVREFHGGRHEKFNLNVHKTVRAEDL